MVPPLENPADLSCLTQTQKQAIAICYQKNANYEKEISNIEITRSLFGWDYKIILWSAIVGGVGGMILEHELAK